MSYVKAVVKGELLTYPQMARSGDRDSDGLIEGMQHVIVREKREDKVPEGLLKDRKFEWMEGNGYAQSQKSSEMSDEIGNYCIHLSDIRQFGDVKPGDEVECDVSIYPVRPVWQRSEGKRKTGDIKLKNVPIIYFCAEGSLRKAGTPAPTPSGNKTKQV